MRAARATALVVVVACGGRIAGAEPARSRPAVLVPYLAVGVGLGLTRADRPELADPAIGIHGHLEVGVRLRELVRVAASLDLGRATYANPVPPPANVTAVSDRLEVKRAGLGLALELGHRVGRWTPLVGVAGYVTKASAVATSTQLGVEGEYVADQDLVVAGELRAGIDLRVHAGAAVGLRAAWSAAHARFATVADRELSLGGPRLELCVTIDLDGLRPGSGPAARP